MKNDDLDTKLADVFSGRVVRKDLVRKIKVGANVPVFVLEYLLGKYCATDDPAAIEAGMRVVTNTLADSFIRSEEANKAQALVKEKERHTFIDKVSVRYLSEDDKYWAHSLNFGNKYIHVPDKFVRDYDRLLMEGIWAEVEIRHQYDEEAKGRRSPFWIERINPVQLASFNLDTYKQGRAQFSTDEWLDVLIRSIGMEPSHFSRRHRSKGHSCVICSSLPCLSRSSWRRSGLEWKLGWPPARSTLSKIASTAGIAAGSPTMVTRSPFLTDVE